MCGSKYIKYASAEEEYKKHKDLKKEDVYKLMQWVDNQPHLPNLEELEVIFFLHSCKYSIEYSKRVIDCHFTFKAQYTDFFTNRSPNDIKGTLESTIAVVLPDLTPSGAAVMYIKNLDNRNYNFTDILKLSIMVGDLYYVTHGTTNGFYTVLDMEGSQMMHFMKTSPFVLKKAIYFMLEATPLERRGCYFINAMPFMEKAMSLIKTYIKAEVLEMIYWISSNNLEKMYKYIPKKILPSDIGGDGPSIKELHAIMIQNIKDHEPYFTFQEKTWKVDKSLRPGKQKNSKDLFRIKGSFKQLNID